MSAFLDVLTAKTPQAWVGTNLRFELAFFYRGVLADISAWDQVSVQIKELTSKTGAALASQTISSGALNTGLTSSQWDNGSSQHAVIEFDDSAVNFDLEGADSKAYHMVVNGLSSDVPAKVMVMGVSVFEMREDGTGSTTPSPTVGANVIPSGATYDGSGQYVVTNLTADKVYEVDLAANDTSLENDVQTVTEDGRFVAAGTSVTLNGTPSALVTARLWQPSYYTADEADARFALAFDTSALWTAIAAAQADASQALLDAAEAHAETFTAADEAAMEALAAEKGDFALRTDENRLYVLKTNDPSDAANWLAFPLDIEWTGTWSGATTYTKNQLAFRGTSTFISQINANLNQDPSNPANVGVGQPWGLIAQGSALTLGTATPEAVEIGAAGNTGSSSKAAHEDHSHPAPDLADWTTSGFQAKADKQRFDNCECGMANGQITCGVVVGNDIYLGGDFTTWDGNTATRLVKIDRNGKADSEFLANLGAGLSAAPQFMIALPGGEILVGASTKTTFKGGGSTWIHKIDPDGNASAGFAAVDTIATTGSDQLLGMAFINPDKVALLAWRTLRVIDLDGASLFTEVSDADMHSLASYGCYLFITSRPSADYGGVDNPAAVKMLDFCEDSGGAFTGAIDANWSGNGGTGWGASAHSIQVAQDGSFVIVGGTDAAAEDASDFDWDGSATTGEGVAKLDASGVGRGSYSSPWTISVAMNSEGDHPTILAVDSMNRVYLTGDIATINATAVTANRLYRVNSDGSGLMEFDAFDDDVTGLVMLSDSRMLVFGDFDTFGGVKVGKAVMMDDTGARIFSLLPNSDLSRTGVYRERYIPASAMAPPQTNGATAAVNTTVTYFRVKDLYRFSDAADSEVQFDVFLPQEWDKSMVRMILDIEPEGVIVPSNGIVFACAIAAIESGEATDKAWSADDVNVISSPSVGQRKESPVFELTPPTTPGTRSNLSVRIKRTPGHASDTAADYVRLRGAILQYRESETEPAAWS